MGDYETRKRVGRVTAGKITQERLVTGWGEWVGEGGREKKVVQVTSEFLN